MFVIVTIAITSMRYTALHSASHCSMTCDLVSAPNISHGARKRGKQAPSNANEAGTAQSKGSDASLEAVDLDRLEIEAQALLLVRQKVLHILALVTLQLNHLAKVRDLGGGDDGAIAGELLLDHFEDLLLVEFLGEALDRGQGFAAIALCGGGQPCVVVEEEGKGEGGDATGRREGQEVIVNTYAECGCGCSSAD